MIDFTMSELHISELFYIKMVHGVELFLTSGSNPVDFQGSTYSPAAIKRGSIKHAIDLSVTPLDVTLCIDAVSLDGRNALMMAHDGYFDAAEFALIFYEHYQNTYEYMFRGIVAGAVESNLSEITLKIKTLMHNLEETIPRFVFQRQCNHSLFDIFCRVDPENFSCGAEVAFSDNSRILTSKGQLAAYPAEYFRCGYVKVTSGANTGQTRRVLYSMTTADNESNWVRYAIAAQSYDAISALYHFMPEEVGLLYLDKPFWNPFALGDTFTVFAGCDKSAATCLGKFNNLANFLGFENVPQSDMALRG